MKRVLYLIFIFHILQALLSIACAATYTDGTCGSAQNTPSDASPAANLCGSGTASTVTDSGQWLWTCTGNDGGSTADCSAPKTSVPTGDCDDSGMVTISEVQSAINMFLGLKPVQTCVDFDYSSDISISEVQKVINSFLGLNTTATVRKTLSGVAAVDGYPVVNGTVRLKLAEENILSTTTGNDGTWQITDAALTLPCAIEVSGGTINGVANGSRYHSVATVFGTTNVTPLTDLMVAGLAAESPDTWFDGLTRTTLTSTVTSASINTALANLRTAFSKLMYLDTINPISVVSVGESGNKMLAALVIAETATGVSHSTLLGAASSSNFATVAAPVNDAVAVLFPAAPAITDIAPNIAVPGTSVTITGINFKTSGANNLVSFNGTAATVTSATSSSLSISVPYNATSGKVSVTTAGGTAVSTGSFTVLPPAANTPTITAFTPPQGVAGVTVTVFGTNFDTTPSYNTVIFNGGAQATVTAATGTTLSVTVPSGAKSGPISVATPNGTTVSLGVFTMGTDIMRSGNFSRLGPVHNYPTSQPAIESGKVFRYSDSGKQTARTEDLCQFRRNSDGSLSEIALGVGPAGTGVETEITRYDWEDLSLPLTYPTTKTTLYLVSSDKVTGLPNAAKWAKIFPFAPNLAHYDAVLTSDGRLCIEGIVRAWKDWDRFPVSPRYIAGATSESGTAEAYSLNALAGKYKGMKVEEMNSYTGDLEKLGFDPVKVPEIRMEIPSSGMGIDVTISDASSTRTFTFGFVDMQNYAPPLNLTNMDKWPPLIDYLTNYKKFRLYDCNPLSWPAKSCSFLTFSFDNSPLFSIHFGISNYDATPEAFQQDGAINFAVAPITDSADNILTFSPPEKSADGKDISVVSYGKAWVYNNSPDNKNKVYSIKYDYGLGLNISYFKLETGEEFIRPELTGDGFHLVLKRDFPHPDNTCHLSGPTKSELRVASVSAEQKIQMADARNAGWSSEALAGLAAYQAEYLKSAADPTYNPPECSRRGITFDAAAGTISFAGTDMEPILDDPRTGIATSVTGKFFFTPLTPEALQQDADAVAARREALSQMMTQAVKESEDIAARHSAEQAQAAQDAEALRAAKEAAAVALAAQAAADAWAAQQAAPKGGSGTAAQYFNKNAVGNSWTRLTTCTGVTCPFPSSSSVSTITASTGGVVTMRNSAGGQTYSSTYKINAAGALISTNIGTDSVNMSTGLYTDPVTVLPASFSSGTTWVRSPAATASDEYVSYPEVSGTIEAFNVTRTVSAGTFTDCLQVKATATSTSPYGTSTTSAIEYYSPSAGGIVESILTATYNYSSLPAMTMVMSTQLQPGYVARP